MLGLVQTVKNLVNLVKYMNEKLEQGKARTIYAGNFIQDAHELTKNDIIQRFEQRISLNDRTEKPMMHFVVAFHPSDNLSDELMSTLAKKYIASAGFGDQPFVVYRHFDTAHPHAHVITTRIGADGNRIHLRPSQIKQLHLLTRRLDAAYGLKPSYIARGDDPEEFNVQQAQRVYRNENSLTRAISDVLNTVIDHYAYTSMDELNAILRRYNVMAYGGKEGTRLYENKGLVYSALNDNGEQITRGINASAFKLRPTRNYLEKKFQMNEPLREYSRQRVQTAIDWILVTRKPDWAGFQEALQWEGIAMVQQDSKDGNGKDVYFIDHREKSAFSGEGLGLQYRLQGLQERTVQQQRLDTEEIQRQQIKLRL